MSLPVALEFANWEPASVRYMQPRVNDRGGKSISIISTQLNRLLYVSTPCMSTWGMSDYVNEAGESDGKFSMTLRFPNPDYDTPETKEFLLDQLRASAGGEIIDGTDLPASASLTAIPRCDEPLAPDQSIPMNNSKSGLILFLF